jgi:hypothetical protein
VGRDFDVGPLVQNDDVFAICINRNNRLRCFNIDFNDMACINTVFQQPFNGPAPIRTNCADVGNTGGGAGGGDGPKFQMVMADLSGLSCRTRRENGHV